MELNNHVAAGAEVYVTGKVPMGIAWIPGLKGCCPIITCYRVIKRTAKGYRLSVSYAPTKGAMYLDEHHQFFSSYEDALNFIASEANKTAAELEGLKLRAIQLMCEAQDEIHAIAKGGAQ